MRGSALPDANYVAALRATTIPAGSRIRFEAIGNVDDNIPEPTGQFSIRKLGVIGAPGCNDTKFGSLTVKRGHSRSGEGPPGEIV